MLCNDNRLVVSVAVAGVTVTLPPSVAILVTVNVELLLELPEILISLPMSRVKNSVFQ